MTQIANHRGGSLPSWMVDAYQRQSVPGYERYEALKSMTKALDASGVLSKPFDPTTLPSRAMDLGEKFHGE